MASKQSRQFAIKEIITAKPISSQDELRVALKKRGYRTTQATLSRDLKELGVGRIATSRGLQYVLQHDAGAEILRPLVGAEVVSISANETMIVIRTLPGCANTVGEYLDSLRHGHIIGTIAGDNTLMVIPDSQRRTKQITQYLREKLVGGKQ
jgi:transcriptional regulator of arginine metabolism